MFYIGADLGTSGLKPILTDIQGKVLRCTTESYSVIQSKQGGQRKIQRYGCKSLNQEFAIWLKM